MRHRSQRLSKPSVKCPGDRSCEPVVLRPYLASSSARCGHAGSRRTPPPLGRGDQQGGSTVRPDRRPVRPGRAAPGARSPADRRRVVVHGSASAPAGHRSHEVREQLVGCAVDRVRVLGLVLWAWPALDEATRRTAVPTVGGANSSVLITSPLWATCVRHASTRSYQVTPRPRRVSPRDAVLLSRRSPGSAAASGRDDLAATRPAGVSCMIVLPIIHERPATISRSRAESAQRNPSTCALALSPPAARAFLRRRRRARSPAAISDGVFSRHGYLLRSVDLRRSEVPVAVVVHRPHPGVTLQYLPTNGQRCSTRSVGSGGHYRAALRRIEMGRSKWRSRREPAQ